ncbi:hypothetical protein [Streptomonospora salina]|uniref:hypothetical protein n=1 Tax=Streptomonospora salina TaxID=104205 RepID=UPI0031E8388A
METVGLTAGASAPPGLVEAVIAVLGGLGPLTVHERDRAFLPAVGGAHVLTRTRVERGPRRSARAAPAGRSPAVTRAAPPGIAEGPAACSGPAHRSGLGSTTAPDGCRRRRARPDRRPGAPPARATTLTWHWTPAPATAPSPDAESPNGAR